LDGKIIIRGSQFYFLTVNYILGTTLFVLIQSVVQSGGRDAWLIPLWGGLCGVVFAFLWIWLYRLHPGKDLVQISLAVLGRPLGTVAAVLYFFHFVMIAGFVLRNLSDFLTGTIMPQTPGPVFHIMFLIVAAYAALQGVETIARLSQLLTPLLVFPFWFVILLATVNWDWVRFIPAFQPETLAGIFRYHSILGYPFLETIALFMFFPFVGHNLGRMMTGGIATAAVSISLTVFAIIGSLGVERTAHLNFPIFSLVEEVALNEVIINIHSVISIILLVLIFIKLQVLIFAAFETLRQTVKPKLRWPLLLGILLLMAGAAPSVVENSIQNGEWTRKYVFPYNAFFGLAIPILLLAVTWIKTAAGKRRRKGR
jgi:spore germination protein KB